MVNEEQMLHQELLLQKLVLAEQIRLRRAIQSHRNVMNALATAYANTLGSLSADQLGKAHSQRAESDRRNWDKEDLLFASLLGEDFVEMLKGVVR